MIGSDDKKSGFVTLIGRPNVGKSTLMNRLIGQKIAIVSDKPQTTRNRIRTVFTDKRGQIIFVDTPGIHKAKNKLGDFMVNAAESSIGDVDLVLYLIEPKAYIGEGDKHIIELLNKCDVPVILLINKIDSLEKKEEILPVIDHYSKAFDFKHIIPVSARTGYGLDDLKDTIFKELPSGPLYYDEDTVTELPEKEIVSELIREQALKALSEEVPHGIAVIIDRMKEYDHITDIDATIICEKDSHKGMIIGKGGSMLKTIGSKARREIEDLVEGHVNLKLWVKVKKNWRDSDGQIKNFGFVNEDQ